MVGGKIYSEKSDFEIAQINTHRELMAKSPRMPMDELSRKKMLIDQETG